MSYSIDIYSQKWAKVGSRDLHKDLFVKDVAINQDLIHEYVVMYLANQRVAIAHTKTRGEVQRSGRKLYRQKGTGRARVGDAWSPIRRKGGVAFGPRNNANFSKTMPQKMKRKALLHALLLKAQAGKIAGIDKLAFKTPKTKDAVGLLTNIDSSQKSILLVLPTNDQMVLHSFRNIPYVTCQIASQLNAYDVMTHQSVVFVQDSLDTVENLLLS